MRKQYSWMSLLIACVAIPLCSCASYVYNVPNQTPGGASNSTGRLAIADEGRILLFQPPLSNNASATIVLGQDGFDSNSTGPAAPDSLMWPAGMATDPSGDLFVADFGHCRVLEFTPPFSNRKSASLVIGQPGFSGGEYPSCSTSGPSGMLAPSSVAFDQQGNLWVADASRVTEYVPPFTNGMAASVAIGQPDLNGGLTCNGSAPTAAAPPSPTASTFCGATSIAVDAHGNLWVTDEWNSRVLEFRPPFSNGMAASMELGQPAPGGLSSVTKSGPTAASFLTPVALAFDPVGDLWVADSYGNRVLEFIPPFTDGMPAALVIGEPNFNTYKLQPTSAQSLSFPNGLTFDQSGDLIISDQEHSRVLLFEAPFVSGMNASLVLGQSSMSSEVTAHTTSASTLVRPDGVLWVK